MMFTFLSIASLSFSSLAEVFDTTITNVTSKSFSVVWVSDEPVISADVAVYSDPAGTSERTVTKTVLSSQITSAHDNGIVQVNITGLSPNSTVYIQTETVSASATTQFPANAPFLELTTATKTTKANAQNELIMNDLMMVDTVGINGVSPSPGTLMIVDIPGVSNYPLSVFVGEGGVPDISAIVNLNNLYDTTSRSADINGEETIQYDELRGLNCVDVQNHRLRRFGKVPSNTESPKLNNLVSPSPCFDADIDCNDTVDNTDFDWVVNGFNAIPEDCLFNPQSDVVSDNVINVLDAQQILNNLGESAPFP